MKKIPICLLPVAQVFGATFPPPLPTTPTPASSMPTLPVSAASSLSRAQSDPQAFPTSQQIAAPYTPNRPRAASTGSITKDVEIGMTHEALARFDKMVTLAETMVRFQLEPSQSTANPVLAHLPPAMITHRAQQLEFEFAQLYDAQRQFNAQVPPSHPYDFNVVSQAAQTSGLQNDFTLWCADHATEPPFNQSNSFLADLKQKNPSNYQKLIVEINNINNGIAAYKQSAQDHKRKVSSLIAQHQAVQGDVDKLYRLLSDRGLTRNSVSPITWTIGHVVTLGQETRWWRRANVHKVKTMISRVLKLALVTWFENKPQVDPNTSQPIWLNWKNRMWKPYSADWKSGDRIKPFEVFEREFLSDPQKFMNAGRGSEMLTGIHEMFGYLRAPGSNSVDKFVAELVDATRQLCDWKLAQKDHKRTRNVARELNKHAKTFYEQMDAWTIRWNAMDKHLRSTFDDQTPGKMFWKQPHDKFKWEH